MKKFRLKTVLSVCINTCCIFAMIMTGIFMWADIPLSWLQKFLVSGAMTIFGIELILDAYMRFFHNEKLSGYEFISLSSPKKK